MPYGSEFLGNVGTGLMNFAGSGLGQTAIGAGLGYGMDRLAGGKGKYRSYTWWSRWSNELWYW